MPAGWHLGHLCEWRMFGYTGFHRQTGTKSDTPFPQHRWMRSRLTGRSEGGGWREDGGRMEKRTSILEPAVSPITYSWALRDPSEEAFLRPFGVKSRRSAVNCVIPGYRNPPECWDERGVGTAASPWRGRRGKHRRTENEGHHACRVFEEPVIRKCVRKISFRKHSRQFHFLSLYWAEHQPWRTSILLSTLCVSVK